MGTFAIAPAVFWREIFPGMLLLLATAAGVSLGYWHLRREVMRRRAIEVRLQAARDLADSAALSKSTFLATMSHEIRTPLSGIIGMLDLLTRASMGAEQRQMLLAVDSAANSLLQMLDQVMDFSKMEANRMSLESVPVDLRVMIQCVVMVMGEPARRRGVKTSWRVDDAVADTFLGDPLRIRQILTNLISNAAKFTAHGEVRLTLTVDDADAGHQSLRFEVTDTGIGIPREKLQQVMTPFRQADASTSRHYGGSGLGLSVSSRLAALMGGKLVLDSEPGQGTRATFVCRLQVRRGAGALVSAAIAPRLAAPAQGERLQGEQAQGERAQDERAQRELAQRELAQREPALIDDSAGTYPAAARHGDVPCLLVVDDHAINRDLIRRQLATLGYACEVRADGAAALDALRSGSYAMLLTDCQMPAMSGAELVQAWREEERRRGRAAAARLPIVMVSAKTEADKPGGPDIDARICKPITLDRLREVLLRWLPPSTLDEGFEHASSSHTAAYAGPHTDPHAGPHTAAYAAPHIAPHIAPHADSQAELYAEPHAGARNSGLALPQLRANFHQDDAALREFLHVSLAALRSDLAQARSGLSPQLCERYADWLHRALGALGMLGRWPVVDEGDELEEALRHAPSVDLLPEMSRFLERFEKALDDIDSEMKRL